MFTGIGKLLILTGAVIVLVGVCLLLGSSSIPWFGRLPGDISIKKDNFSFYFPLTTCILISAILSLLFHLFRR